MFSISDIVLSKPIPVKKDVATIIGTPSTSDIFSR